MSESRLEVLLSGHVQGVGMRHFVRVQAFELRLTGYVRNLPNGQVEIVAEGNKKNLMELEQRVRKSGIGNIEKMTVQWQEPKGEFSEFRIKH